MYEHFESDIETNAEHYFKLIEKRSTILIRKFSHHHISHLDDVCQNIFEKVYKNKHTYDPTREFKPWLNTIVHNEVITFLKTDYTHITRTEPLEFQMEEETVDNYSLLQMGTNKFLTGESDQESNVIINDILKYMIPKLNDRDIKILKCYLNPSKEFEKFVKKKNKKLKKKSLTYDKIIIEFLGITHHKLNSAKAKFYIHINEWCEL